MDLYTFTGTNKTNYGYDYLRQNPRQQFLRVRLPIFGQIVLHRLIPENISQNLWNSSIIFEDTSFLQFHTYT